MNRITKKNNGNQKRFEENNVLDKSMDCITNEKKNKKNNTNNNQKEGYNGPMKKQTKQIQPSKSYINLFHANKTNRFKNDFYKTVKIYYQNIFIQNINIYADEKFNSIMEKIKNILLCAGIVLYRAPSSNDIIERINSSETLEYLLNRGVIVKNTGVVINHKGFNYPPSVYNYYNLQNRDVFNVKLEGKLLGAGFVGFCFEFVDIDDLTKPKYYKISKGNCKWRQVGKGLNIFGKCSNKKCKVYNKEVIYIAGINIQFDFYSDNKKIKCPMCSKNFIPITMGFWKCEYQIKGEKFNDGEYQKVDINGKETKGDEFEYYNPNSKKPAIWSKLIIFTGHRQQMKYNKYTI